MCVFRLQRAEEAGEEGIKQMWASTRLNEAELERLATARRSRRPDGQLLAPGRILPGRKDARSVSYWFDDSKVKNWRTICGLEAESDLVRLVPAQSRCNNSQHDSVQTKRKGRPSAVLTLPTLPRQFSHLATGPNARPRFLRQQPYSPRRPCWTVRASTAQCRPRYWASRRCRR
jgi:hypothetical protein